MPEKCLGREKKEKLFQIGVARLATGEGVDGTTAAFLYQSDMKLRKKYYKEAMKQEKERRKAERKDVKDGDKDQG